MSKNKWGQSFLKSGLPLEHVAALALRAAGWSVRANIEYQRELHHADAPWFEIDLFATSDQNNNGSAVSLLAECKYHDTSRFWMFMPVDSPMFGSSDARFLNLGPVHALRAATSKVLRELAPLSSVGTVLSRDGQKQENAIHVGIQQLANAFVPFGIPDFLDYLDLFDLTEPGEDFTLATAMVPTLITNASLFRLRPEVVDLEVIGNARAPDEIADPVKWTWCRFNMPSVLFAANQRFFNQLLNTERHRFDRFPRVETRIKHLLRAPSWIAVERQ